MPNPTLAPEYWVDETLIEICRRLERWASISGNASLAAAAKDLRDNRLEIIASVTKPEGGD